MFNANMNCDEKQFLGIRVMAYIKGLINI